MEDNEIETDENDDEIESNKEQAHRIFHILLDAIPDDVCYYNVLGGIYQLANEITLLLHEEAHGESDGDDEDISDIGNIGGTQFSKN